MCVYFHLTILILICNYSMIYLSYSLVSCPYLFVLCKVLGPSTLCSHHRTFFGDESAVFGLRSGFAQTTHVLCEDPKIVLVPNHQLCDGDAAAMIVLNAREPLLKSRVKRGIRFFIFFRIEIVILVYFQFSFQPLSSCLLFGWCSPLLAHSRCLSGGSRPELHFFPTRLQ